MGIQLDPSGFVSARSTLVMQFDSLVADAMPASAAVTSPSQLVIQACTQFTIWLYAHAFIFFSAAAITAEGTTVPHARKGRRAIASTAWYNAQSHRSGMLDCLI